MTTVSVHDHDHNHDHRVTRTSNLRYRHASALTKLMDERDDLRGVNALADLVDDSVRWSV